MRPSLLLLLVALLGASTACSALVTPDPSRLGGRDAGPSPGVDAFRPMTGCASGCDDGVECARDACVSDVCQHTPDDSLCGAMQRCAATGCVATSCSGPADCNDGNDCTLDRCIEGACMPIPRDADMDGRGDAACGGDDCDDANAAIAPGRPEICGNGLDDDCNPATSDTCTGMLPDRCDTAQVVDLSSGSAVVRGDFGMLAADYDTFCIEGGGRGPDAVYRLDLGTRIVDLRIETLGAVDTVLSVSVECGNFDLPACNDDQRPGADANARVWVHPAAGTLYVLVSSFDGMGGGPYEVHFTASPVAPNECGEGSLDVTEGGTVIAVPIPPSRVTGTCMPDGTSRAIETAMHFDGGNIDRLRLYAGYQAYLHARSICDLDGEELCEAGSPLGTGSFVDTNARTDARRLHIFVDGATRMDQGFALFVEP
jgi:hypothetical protein